LDQDPTVQDARRRQAVATSRQRRLVVPDNWELKKEIFDEGHLSKFSIHPGSSKMYQD
jgi:hypothetical protein